MCRTCSAPCNVAVRTDAQVLCREHGITKQSEDGDWEMFMVCTSRPIKASPGALTHVSR